MLLNQRGQRTVRRYAPMATSSFGERGDLGKAAHLAGSLSDRPMSEST
jgi:hypothetical protein